MALLSSSVRPHPPPQTTPTTRQQHPPNNSTDVNITTIGMTKTTARATPAPQHITKQQSQNHHIKSLNSGENTDTDREGDEGKTGQEKEMEEEQVRGQTAIKTNQVW